MKKNHYQFLFFTYDWNNEVTLPCFRGVEQFLERYEDAQVTIVEGFGRYGETIVQEDSLRIFEVPELSEFDGVAIQGNRAWTPELKQELAEKARECGIPVVSLNEELNNSMYVGTDNFAAMKSMVDHVIEKHNARRLAYICGLEESSEARDREQAFRRSCRAHGIPEYDCKFYPGSWAKEDGEKAAELLIKDAGGSRNAYANLPSAVICANDDLAAGVVKKLKEAGIRIPQDILVTGFDHLLIGETCQPQITTVSRDYSGIAFLALETLYHRATGREVSEKVYAPSRLVESGSCGCVKQQILTDRLLERFARMEENAKQYYMLRDEAAPVLERAETISDIMEVFEQFGGMFGTGNAYLVINKEYFSDLHNAETVQHYGERMLLMGVTREQRERIGRYGEGHIYAEFDRKEILPDLVADVSRLHLMYPLRYEQICIGYVIADHVADSMGFQFLELTLKRLEYAIEAARKKHLLQVMNYHLNRDYSI